MCSPGSDIFYHPQQQAIEDLQSEEEKVNLLTKEKTKLQMHTEDVCTYFSNWTYSSYHMHYTNVFFQYLFCNFWNLRCVIAQCAFKLKCRTVLSNSSQTCSPGCNVGCSVLFHDVKLVNVFECFESLSYCRMKAWPTTLAFKLLKFQQLVYNFECLSFVLDGKL